MSAADLTMTRTTDLHGNTLWRDSPLIAAAVNGDVVLHFYDGEDIGYQRQFNFFFEVILKKSDQLYLYNRNAATIYASNVHPLTFLGYLM